MVAAINSINKNLTKSIGILCCTDDFKMAPLSHIIVLSVERMCIIWLTA